MQKKSKSRKPIFYVTVGALICVVAFVLSIYFRDQSDDKNTGSAASTSTVDTTADAANPSTADNSQEDAAEQAPADTANTETASADTTASDASSSVTQTPAAEDGVVYSNTDYGFEVQLPDSWEGYTIVTDSWNGIALDGDKQGENVASGDIIKIRNPKWTEDNPYQDIPVMVFTLDQWDQVSNEKMAVSAAPIPPAKLGSNSKYVFALPARYNYAFPTGFEEVEDIVASNPLVGNENFTK